MIGIQVGITVGGEGSAGAPPTKGALNIILLDAADPSPSGAALVYTVTVGNSSAVAATTVACVVTLDASLAYVSSTGSGWGIAVNGQAITFTRASLGLGSAPIITINTTAGNTTSSITTTAQVTSANSDTINASQGTAIVRPTWSCTFTGTVSGQVSSSVVYTLVVTNSGAGSVNTASFDITLDAALTWASSVGDGWTLTRVGQVVTAKLSPMAVGVQVAVVITGTAPGAPASLSTTCTGTAANAANLSPAAVATSIVTITTDGPGLWLRPASLAEWQAVGGGIPAPQFYLEFDDASGSIIDKMQSLAFPAFGAPTYANAYAGWTSKTINTTDGTALEGFGLGNNLSWEPATQSMVMLVYAGLSVDANRRCFLMFSGASTRLDVLSTGKFQLAPGSTSGTVNYKDSAIHPFVIELIPGAPVLGHAGAGLYRVSTDKEKVTGVWARGNGGQHGIAAAGTAGQTSATAQYNMAAVWIGSAADVVSAIGPKTLLQTLNVTVTGY